MPDNSAEKTSKGLYTCLMADDDEHIVELLTDYLAKKGLFKQVVVALDGLDARKKIINQRFDVIVLDINMPRIDGLEVLEYMFEAKKQAISSVIIVSGELSKERLAAMKKLGVVHFLVKPFSVDKFSEKIFKILPDSLQKAP